MPGISRWTVELSKETLAGCTHHMGRTMAVIMSYHSSDYLIQRGKKTNLDLKGAPASYVLIVLSECPPRRGGGLVGAFSLLLQ